MRGYQGRCKVCLRQLATENRRKKKQTQILNLMKKEKLPNGLWRLTAPNGVIDTRNGRHYSEVECEEKDIKYFKEA